MLVRSCCYWCELVKAIAASFFTLLESSFDLSLMTHVKCSSLGFVMQLCAQNNNNNTTNDSAFTFVCLQVVQSLFFPLHLMGLCLESSYA